MKRAYQGSLRFQRKELDRYGLTPARFDLMYVLKQANDEGWGLRQSELRRELGVAPPTVSRMLASLERLGFVRRSPRQHTRYVWLTRLGRYVTRRAAKHTIHSGLAIRRVSNALRFRPRQFDFVSRDDFHSELSLVASRFGDSGNTLLYPWHPDD